MKLTLPDHELMLIYADDWGPRSDPDRRWFLAGWRDQGDGQALGANRDPSETTASRCAYNSGWVASRER